MLAARIAYSSEGHAEVRARYFEDHKLYLRSAGLKIRQSGPLLNGDGSQIGALIVAEVEDLAELTAFSARDPFVVQGVYREVEILEWRVTIGP
ncbi:YciI family protein [Rhizobium johnstonii]|uniref:YciI family protein n=1 Tax=Rhizobium TaxID=379 RepID=UPI001032262E|nr:YciI family protein [Rhizobium leguminosarum]TBF70703.1 YciI family protein [Rhizobium leguminosarum]TBG93426.1 YciI family protein [Rhizobium leguminosarum]TBG95953.1 YciI family protein [Rhizobium leguminosarum]TBH28805.1 YciI family protein [Rhizobium leguminosarum]TBH50251.1 YciI family protein [Rhizobium leguminosarum]